MAFRFSSVQYSAIFLIASSLVCLFSSSASLAATWTDLRGEHTIEADLVGVWGDQAILRKNDGTRISIRLMDLRSDSRIQAEKLNSVLNQQRNARVAELKKIAAEADAAAPSKPTQPAPALAYTAPTPEMMPDAFLQHVNNEAQKGHHFVVYYDALPPSYRADVDELFATAVSKLDPTNWASLASTLQGFGELILTRQNWIFSHPRFIAASDTSGQKLPSGLLALAGALNEGFKAENVSLEKVRSMKLREYLAFQDAALAPYLAELAKLNDSLPQFIVESTKQDVAILSVSQGAQTQKVSFTKVEGFWIPTDYATKWQANMTSAKAELAAIANGGLLSGGVASMAVSTVDSMIAPLREARDATQFHLAMESVFPVAQPLVLMIATATGGMKAGGGNPGYDNYGMDGYDESMSGNDGASGYENMNSSGPPGSGSPSSGPPGSGPGSGPPGSGPPGAGPGSGPPTNAMENARRTSEAASRRGPPGSQ